MLIFSIALNGYARFCKRSIASQQDYAERLGADYICVTQPSAWQMAAGCCWLKVPLLLKAMEAGYEHVMYVEADTFINADAPDICEELVDGKQVYMANDEAGHINSGVILMRHHALSIHFLLFILLNRNKPLVEGAKVPQEENIHMGRAWANSNATHLLGSKWQRNNCASPENYIFRISTGKALKAIKYRVLKRLAMRGLRCFVFRSISVSQQRKSESKLLSEVLKRYPEHFAATPAI